MKKVKMVTIEKTDNRWIHLRNNTFYCNGCSNSLDYCGEGDLNLILSSVGR